MRTTQTSRHDSDLMIDALFADSEPVSIIDGLLDLPAGAEHDTWERLVRARLEARLVERMRQRLDVRPQPKAA